MIAVAAPLWLSTGSGASWHFITVPAEQSDEIRAAAFAEPRGFGSVRVAASIGGVRWQTSVFPQKDGGYILPVKGDVRKRAGIAAGDLVALELELL